MTKDARFWDRIADKYSKTPISDENIYQRKLKLTQDRLTPDMNVLEFGCGTGGTALMHATHVSHIHAIDVSARMIEIAKEKQADAGVENVTFQVSAIDSFKAEGSKFDAILGLNILHLVKDPQAIIANVGNLLKPGGFFVSSTFAANDHAAWLRFIAPAARLIGKFPPVLEFFSLSDLKKWHEDSHLIIEEEWRTGKMNADFLIARKALH